MMAGPFTHLLGLDTVSLGQIQVKQYDESGMAWNDPKIIDDSFCCMSRVDYFNT